MIQTHGLVSVIEAIPDLVLDIRYATPNNFLNVTLYSKAACYLHGTALEALISVQKQLVSMGLGLKVFDGYRPLAIQQKMWDAIQDERYVANPKTTGGRHTRGTAIDLTLVDSAGHELEMPTEFDNFTERAHSDFAKASKEAKQHRACLKSVMEAHGFDQLPTEWWHFDLSGWQNNILYPPLNVSFEELELFFGENKKNTL